MMFIQQPGLKERTWHVGEPIPPLLGRVVTFQADGDELELILVAMRESYELVKIGEKLRSRLDTLGEKI